MKEGILNFLGKAGLSETDSGSLRSRSTAGNSRGDSAQLGPLPRRNPVILGNFLSRVS